MVDLMVDGRFSSRGATSGLGVIVEPFCRVSAIGLLGEITVDNRPSSQGSAVTSFFVFDLKNSSFKTAKKMWGCECDKQILGGDIPLEF